MSNTERLETTECVSTIAITAYGQQAVESLSLEGMFDWTEFPSKEIGRFIVGGIKPTCKA